MRVTEPRGQAADWARRLLLAGAGWVACTFASALGLALADSAGAVGLLLPIGLSVLLAPALVVGFVGRGAPGDDARAATALGVALAAFLALELPFVLLLDFGRTHGLLPVVLGAWTVAAAVWACLQYLLSRLGSHLALEWRGAARDPTPWARRVARVRPRFGVAPLAVRAPMPGQTCPYCRDPLLSEGAAGFVACGACRTLLHRGCLRENEGCTTAGCANARRRGSVPALAA